MSFCKKHTILDPKLASPDVHGTMSFIFLKSPPMAMPRATVAARSAGNAGDTCPMCNSSAMVSAIVY